MCRILQAIFIILLASCVHDPQYIQAVNKKNDAVKFLEAKKSFDNKNYDTAVNLLKEVAVDSDNVKHLYLYAEALRLNGECEQALKILDKVLKLNKNHSDAYASKGVCYTNYANFKEAEFNFKKAASLGSKNWRTYNGLGVIYSSEKYIDEALQMYNNALDIDMQNPAILNNIALTLAMVNDYERAIKILDKAKTYLGESDSKKTEQIDYNLALFYGIEGQGDKSREILEKYLSEYAIKNNLGVYARLADNPKLAEAYFKSAISSSPSYYKKAKSNSDIFSEEDN